MTKLRGNNHEPVRIMKIIILKVKLVDWIKYKYNQF